jgi:hypothetical protein
MTTLFTRRWRQRTSFAAVCLFWVSQGAGASPITFQDNFDRPDGAPGNGWNNGTGNMGGELRIFNGALTTPSAVANGAAAIFRTIDFSAQVIMSATLTQSSAYRSLPNRYESGFLFGSDSSRTSGYEVLFGRSDNSFNNSSVVLLQNGHVISTIFSPIQYGASIAPTINYSPADGTISGSVLSNGQRFNFNFGAHTGPLAGSAFGIDLEFPDARGTTILRPTIDNLSLSYGRTSIAPSAIQLAGLADDAYAGGTSAPAGFSRVPLTGIGPSTGGFGAAAFVNTAGDRVVLALAGTDDWNDVLADTTFTNPLGIPTTTFRSYVRKAAQALVQLKSLHPNAEITLTGHSLGGALAQLLAADTGISVTTFNAPGAIQTLPQLTFELQPLSGWVPNVPQTSTNYRVYGDLVSTVGTQLGGQITYDTPASSTLIDLFPIAGAKSMHLLSTLMGQISTGAPISTTAGPTLANIGLSALSQISRPNVLGSIRFGTGIVSAGLSYLIDPGGVDGYQMLAEAGSPNFRSVLFPLLLSIDGEFLLEEFLGSHWVNMGAFSELDSFDFGASGVEQFRFFVLDRATGRHATNVENFTFGVAFVRDGEFTGQLNQFSTVEEPQTIALVALLLGLLYWAARSKRAQVVASACSQRLQEHLVRGHELEVTSEATWRPSQPLNRSATKPLK